MSIRAQSSGLTVTLCISGEEAKSEDHFPKRGAPSMGPREVPSADARHILFLPFCEGNSRPTVGQFDPAPILNTSSNTASALFGRQMPLARDRRQ